MSARVSVIIVASGRRGLGSTVVAALVALAAMAAGRRVAWLEAEAPEGGPDTLAGRLANAESHDLAVIDAGASPDAVRAACALTAAPMLLVVTGDDRADMAASYGAIKLALAANADASLAIVANRVDASAGRWAAEALADACARFLDRAARVAGTIPDDPTLAAALAAGMPIADAAEGSPVSEAAARVAQLLFSSAPTDRSTPDGARRAAPPAALSLHTSRRS